ncbi:hypothetical protein AMTR_s00238p00014570 [Amborella trichopoda]|uniref:Uncharacterized protein n=1 Tax=Amborella trichopoda TaxID=13333 RepID=W1NPZ9_AMBTC|nr:hypothetical protein AMTR_s00238p00014570 [Amborella trichopoda]
MPPNVFMREHLRKIIVGICDLSVIGRCKWCFILESLPHSWVPDGDIDDASSLHLELEAWCRSMSDSSIGLLAKVGGPKGSGKPSGRILMRKDDMVVEGAGSK